jgi:hypothetical protein
MAKAEITVHIADLPIVNAKIAELDRIGAALRGEQAVPAHRDRRRHPQPARASRDGRARVGRVASPHQPRDRRPR